MKSCLIKESWGRRMRRSWNFWPRHVPICVASCQNCVNISVDVIRWECMQRSYLWRNSFDNGKWNSVIFEVTTNLTQFVGMFDIEDNRDLIFCSLCWTHNSKLMFLKRSHSSAAGEEYFARRWFAIFARRWFAIFARWFAKIFLFEF